MMRALVSLSFVASLASCGGEEVAGPPPRVLRPPSLASELGVNVYEGFIHPIVESVDGDETTYTFSPAEGPMCLRGDPFRMAVRDQPDSNDLVIFLQGGGACFSEFCLAINQAPPGIPGVDLLDPSEPANPVAGWDVVYLPYCDGSFFAGDAVIDDDLNGNGPRFHRGLANLTAALEVAAARFPNPDRVFFAGSSGGAYGLLLGLPLVRHYFRDVEIITMADSGIGLARTGDSAYLQRILDQFALARFLPPDCPECTDGAHLTGLVGWYLDRDPDVRLGTFSGWYDGILASVFLQVPPEDFADALASQTAPLAERYPDRFRRFVVDGIQHTSLLGDASGIIGTDLTAVEIPAGVAELLFDALLIQGLSATEIDGLTMADWLAALIADDPDGWPDLLQERGPPPEAP